MMRFSIAVNMERARPDEPMPAVAEHALRMVKMAEAGGFEIAWAAEHHCIELTIAPNPFLILTHWAARTERIRLGTAVVVAPYWNPIRAAAEAALTDLYSRGRLELGLGRGAFQYEFDRMGGGIPQEEGGAYLRELLPVLKKLWAGDYAHEGQSWRFPTATSVPKPVQAPHPPLWIAARSPDTFDFAIRNGAGIMSTPLSKPFGEVASLAAKLEHAVEANPGCPRPRWLVLRRTCVYEDEKDWPFIARTALDYSKRFEGLFSTTGAVRNGFPQSSSAEAGRTGTHTLAAVGEGMVHGTPYQVIEKLKRYEAIGVDSYCYGGNFSLPREMSLRSLELFTKEVMPHFRSGRASEGGHAA